MRRQLVGVYVKNELLYYEYDKSEGRRKEKNGKAKDSNY